MERQQGEDRSGAAMLDPKAAVVRDSLFRHQR